MADNNFFINIRNDEKKSLKSDGQLFNQYHQNELTQLQFSEHRKDHTQRGRAKNPCNQSITVFILSQLEQKLL